MQVIWRSWVGAVLACFLFGHVALAEDTATKPAPAKDDPATQQNEGPEAVAEEAKDGEEKDEKPAADRFIRVRRDKRNRPIAMETAIVTYTPAGEKYKGVVVDLVGAVHVGDAAYYAALNKAFKDYDVVLYELVAPEGTKIPKGGEREGGSFVGALQGGMKSVLALEHQLEQIDYTKENFVHADMSPEEFARSMSERGESFLQMLLKAMSQSAAMQNGGKNTVSDVDLLMALFSKDRPLRLKRLMAAQMEDMESQMDIFDGPDGSTIITERNKKCLEVLKKELDKGRKHIAIFYGAGHFPDMEKRLTDDFNLKRDADRWLVAWDMAVKGEPADDGEAKPAADPDADRDPFDDGSVAEPKELQPTAP